MIGRKTTGKENYETTNDYRKDKTILESGLSAVLTHYQQLSSVLFIPNIVRLIYHPSRLYGKIKTSL